ncbi:MAG: response regulator transcription factor [Sulfuriferula sp.]
MTDDTSNHNGILPSLLLVDDDRIFCDVLARALKKRGYDVTLAHDVESALILVMNKPFEYALVDLKMPGPSGLTLVEKLGKLDQQIRTVVLTGYASIATAIEAIKLGAVHYLTKPADAHEILAALHCNESDGSLKINPSPLSVNRMEWEHIQKILSENNGNISATARALNMHRRTLQRKLGKYPVKQ